jgi:hypothetical protein
MATIFIQFVVAKATVHNDHLTVFTHDIVIFVASYEITATLPLMRFGAGGTIKDVPQFAPRQSFGKGWPECFSIAPGRCDCCP